MKETGSVTFEIDVELSEVPVLVDFWASWCRPCKVLAPVLEQLTLEYEGKAKIVKLDVDAHRDVADRFKVTGLPTLLVFKNGKVVGKHVGAASKEKIKALLESQL